MNSRTNGEDDEDCLFLENVLDKLYDFGNGSASKKKLKSSKKKKRKRCEEEEEEDECPTIQETYDDTKDSRASQQNQQQQTQTEQTGSSSRQVNQVEVVTYQDPRKKQKTRQIPAPAKDPALPMTEQEEINQPEELSLEKARLEVHRFGITGYKKEQQRVFEKDRAIMLGARPPKKEYMNYKAMQKQIQEKKKKAKEEIQPELKKKKKPSNQRDKKKSSSGSSSMIPSGQVGRFKNGMLILSSKEIQKIKGNKRRR